ncbi:hypothetical protein EMCRGX_G003080 [Ephydatia muelleri]
MSIGESVASGLSLGYSQTIESSALLLSVTMQIVTLIMDAIICTSRCVPQVPAIDMSVSCNVSYYCESDNGFTYSPKGIRDKQNDPSLHFNFEFESTVEDIETDNDQFITEYLHWGNTQATALPDKTAVSVAKFMYSSKEDLQRTSHVGTPLA